MERIFGVTNGYTNGDVNSANRTDGPKETRHPLRQVRRGYTNQCRHNMVFDASGHYHYTSRRLMPKPVGTL